MRREYPDYRSAITAALEEQQTDPHDVAGLAWILGYVCGEISNGNIIIEGGHSPLGYEESLAFLADRDNFFNDVLRDPRSYFVDMNTAHMAGSVLPTMFGNEKSTLWNDIVSVAHKRREGFPFVGHHFTEEDLRLIGEFSRFIGRGRRRECIDERLDYLPHASEVHGECGACADVSKTIQSVTPVEDRLHNHFGGKDGVQKQPVLPAMNHHCSTTIYVDLHNHPKTLHPAQRHLARHFSALPFITSFSASHSKTFVEMQGLNDRQIDQFLSAWTNWNIGAARGIIGHHNELHHHADRTQLVIDTRGVFEDEMTTRILHHVRKVQHESELRIA